MTGVYVLSPRAKADIDRIWTDTAKLWEYFSGSHVVFYKTIDGGGVDVVRILHERMDFGRHL